MCECCYDEDMEWYVQYISLAVMSLATLSFVPTNQNDPFDLKVFTSSRFPKGRHGSMILALFLLF